MAGAAVARLVVTGSMVLASTALAEPILTLEPRATLPALGGCGASQASFGQTLGAPEALRMSLAGARGSDRQMSLMGSPLSGAGVVLAARNSSRADTGGARPALTMERARTLLRSVTVPGWGQAVLGHTTSARLFALAELGIWSTFTAFRIQDQMRRDAYERTARILAGIDLSGRDEEFRRIVGVFLNSDEYNRRVVYVDAAKLYLSDLNHLDYAGYRAYIARHSVQGADGWAWDSQGSAARYRDQRKNAKRAAQLANGMLAAAILNRLVSAAHAAQIGRSPFPQSQSWNFEVGPAVGPDVVALRLGVRTRF